MMAELVLGHTLFCQTGIMSLTKMLSTCTQKTPKHLYALGLEGAQLSIIILMVSSLPHRVFHTPLLEKPMLLLYVFPDILESLCRVIF